MRFIRRRAAAPSAPPTRPLHAVSACTISSRCFLAYSSTTLLSSLREFVSSLTDLLDLMQVGMQRLFCTRFSEFCERSLK